MVFSMVRHFISWSTCCLSFFELVKQISTTLPVMVVSPAFWFFDDRLVSLTIWDDLWNILYQDRKREADIFVKESERENNSEFAEPTPCTFDVPTCCDFVFTWQTFLIRLWHICTSWALKIRHHVVCLVTIVFPSLVIPSMAFFIRMGKLSFLPTSSYSALIWSLYTVGLRLSTLRLKIKLFQLSTKLLICSICSVGVVP